ncbi:hypothetical protein ABTG71_20485, partial [Acinetobacter baumannii]
FLRRVPFARKGRRRYEAPAVAVPAALQAPTQKSLSTQAAFGLILNEIGRERSALAERIVTTAPDVTVSTNLGAWVN